MTQPHDIIRAVSEETGIITDCLVGTNPRAYRVAKKRHLAMLFLREHCGLSWSKVALEMDCAASSVQHGCRAAKRRLESDIKYRDLYWRVNRRLSTAPANQ